MHLFQAGGRPRPSSSVVDLSAWNEENDEDVALFMTMGYQDLGGISMILSLKEVIATMEPVIYCDDINIQRKYQRLYNFYCES